MSAPAPAPAPAPSLPVFAYREAGRALAAAESALGDRSMWLLGYARICSSMSAGIAPAPALRNLRAKYGADTAGPYRAGALAACAALEGHLAGLNAVPFEVL